MIIAIFVLLAVVVLALAETGLTRMSRAKALALAESGRPARRGARALVAGPGVHQPAAAGGALPSRRCRPRSPRSSPSGSSRRRGGDRPVRQRRCSSSCCARRPRRRGRCSTPTSPRWPPPRRSRSPGSGRCADLRGLIGLTNVILPGKGLKQGPFVSEEELLAVADEAVEDDGSTTPSAAQSGRSSSSATRSSAR